MKKTIYKIAEKLGLDVVKITYRHKDFKCTGYDLTYKNSGQGLHSDNVAMKFEPQFYRNGKEWFVRFNWRINRGCLHLTYPKLIKYLNKYHIDILQDIENANIYKIKKLKKI